MHGISTTVSTDITQSKGLSGGLIVLIVLLAAVFAVLGTITCVWMYCSGHCREYTLVKLIYAGDRIFSLKTLEKMCTKKKFYGHFV